MLRAGVGAAGRSAGGAVGAAGPRLAAAAPDDLLPGLPIVPPSAGTVLAGAREVTMRTEDGLELGAWSVPPTGADRKPDRAGAAGQRRLAAVARAAGRPARRGGVHGSAAGLPRVRREPGQPERGRAAHRRPRGGTPPGRGGQRAGPDDLFRGEPRRRGGGPAGRRASAGRAGAALAVHRPRRGRGRGTTRSCRSGCCSETGFRWRSRSRESGPRPRSSTASRDTTVPPEQSAAVASAAAGLVRRGRGGRRRPQRPGSARPATS